MWNGFLCLPGDSPGLLSFGIPWRCRGARCCWSCSSPLPWALAQGLPLKPFPEVVDAFQHIFDLKWHHYICKLWVFPSSVLLLWWELPVLLLCCCQSVQTQFHLCPGPALPIPIAGQGMAAAQAHLVNFCTDVLVWPILPSNSKGIVSFYCNISLKKFLFYWCTVVFSLSPPTLYLSNFTWSFLSSW